MTPGHTDHHAAVRAISVNCDDARCVMCGMTGTLAVTTAKVLDDAIM